MSCLQFVWPALLTRGERLAVAIGNGNSMATMVLLVVVAVWSMQRARPDLVIVALLVATTVMLLLMQDMHGFAVSFGLPLGVVSRRYGVGNLISKTALLREE